MKTTTYYAQKDLVIEGKQIKAGETLLTVQSDVPVERALNAIAIGSAGPTKPAEPKPAAPAAAPAKG